MARAVHRSEHSLVEGGSPARIVEIVEASSTRRADRVHEGVDGTQTLGDLGKRRDDLLLVGRIRLDAGHIVGSGGPDQLHCVVTVTEEDIVAAMRFCFSRMKIVIEPSVLWRSA